MGGDSKGTAIPWYWNIICASIAGSTAEVCKLLIFRSQPSHSILQRLDFK